MVHRPHALLEQALAALKARELLASCHAAASCRLFAGALLGPVIFVALALVAAAVVLIICAAARQERIVLGHLCMQQRRQQHSRQHMQH
jgi:asparagine N-glycosylation enzyme membrane subunit Stt3